MSVLLGLDGVKKFAVIVRRLGEFGSNSRR